MYSKAENPVSRWKIGLSFISRKTEKFTLLSRISASCYTQALRVRRWKKMESFILINLFISHECARCFSRSHIIISLISRQVVKSRVLYAGKLNNMNIIYTNAYKHTCVYVCTCMYTYVTLVTFTRGHQLEAHIAITHETTIGRFPGNRTSPTSS